MGFREKSAKTSAAHASAVADLKAQLKGIRQDEASVRQEAQSLSTRVEDLTQRLTAVEGEKEAVECVNARLDGELSSALSASRHTEALLAGVCVCVTPG